MTHGILPAGTTEKQREAVAAADEAGMAAGEAVRKAPGAISEMVGKVSDSVSEFFSGGDAADSDGKDADPATPGAKPARKFSWGNTIGGVLGVGGAWLLSSVFGGGWLGTVMFALFAIPGFMMGHSQLGGMLSRLMGETPRTPAAGAEASTPSQAISKEQAATPEKTASTPQQQLQAELSEVAEKSKLARAMVFRMVDSDAITGRRGNELMEDVVPVEKDLHRAYALNANTLSSDELRAIYEDFTKAEKKLDRIIDMDPILKAQTNQDIRSGSLSYANLRTSIGANLSLAPQGVDTPNDAALPSQNYTGQPSSGLERR